MSLLISVAAGLAVWTLAGVGFWTAIVLLGLGFAVCGEVGASLQAAESADRVRTPVGWRRITR